MTEHLPIIVVELVLVLGGTLLFAWWQLRDVRRAQERSRAERAQREALQSEQQSEQGGPAAAPGEGARDASAAASPASAVPPAARD